MCRNTTHSYVCIGSRHDQGPLSFIVKLLFTSFNRTQITKFNASVEEILREGETHLADIEWAESGVQRAFLEYRDQVSA